MSLLATFETISKNFKLKPQAYIIDNWIFRLHYKASVLIFLVSSLLVCSRQYIGEHIRCIADGGVPEHVMNTFCFFTSTFTVPWVNITEDLLSKTTDIKHLDASLLDSGNLAHPGVGPYGMNSTDPIKKHAYYQWVPFVLFGQAIMFYITHMLWKKLEGGRLRYLVDGLKLAAFSLAEEEITVRNDKIPSRKDKEENIRVIREAFLTRVYINKSWSIKLIFCEVLNLLHIILQIYITNKFLQGNFNNLGVEIMNDGLESNVDILDEVFPKVTKCTFYKYGPSGSLQLHDAMCVMALNVINEKIYTYLWFWFVFLFICTALGLVWRILTLFLHSNSKRFNQMVFANTCPGKLNPWNVLTVSKRCNYTDWLFLNYLSKNIDGMVFREIFIGLAEELEEKESSKEALIMSEEGSKYD
ncbi:innexin inx7 isoform X1 [Anoplophora glabripennis]|uniref:innexin inx7 isoform X1 n=1 Tax=Anoplophora glabripennis TaxID=217634 RepID=UPI00087416A4|nr:innexin inx7 isoform X1 [Anoplophora glabripennis]